MNKRKLEINQVKKTALRAKKHKTVTTKYEVALSFFKQKELKNSKIFTIDFQPLICDLLDQLSNVELAYKLQNEITEQLHAIQANDENIKIDGFCLKYISKEFPIYEIMECISIKKDMTTKTSTLQINKNKLMLFYKHIRSIYPDFCYCSGQKIIVQGYQIKNFYENFKLQWAKVNERGRMRTIQKIQKLICRSLFFVGALVENNIFEDIQQQDRKKKQQFADLGTKSEKKRNFKGITHQVSSTYSFGSTDMHSNLSYGIKSQHSNEEEYYKSGYSQKSQKIIRKQRCLLWQKAEIKQLKCKIPVDHHTAPPPERVQVDLLSNDTENILIDQAFKFQKLKNANDRKKFNNPYQAYLNMNYSQQYFHQMYPHYQQQQQTFAYQNYLSEDMNLNQSRRSSNTSNFVETRKTNSRLGNNKYS